MFRQFYRLCTFTKPLQQFSGSVALRRASLEVCGGRFRGFTSIATSTYTTHTVRAWQISGTTAAKRWFAKSPTPHTASQDVRGVTARSGVLSFAHSILPTQMFGLNQGSVGYSLVLSGLVALGTNTIGFVIAAVTKTHKITDLVGCGTFGIAAWATHIAASRANNLSVFEPNKPLFLTLAVTAWSVRLGGFLFYRVLQTKTDKRFDDFYAKEGEPWFVGPSKYPLKLAGFWLTQALWSFTVLLPVTTANAAAATKSMGPWGWIGFALFMGAWAFEATADFQKNAFKNSPGNKGEFMRTGLYKLCQYPNYFGEIMCWITMWAWAGFPSVFVNHPWIIISPIFTTLLLRYVSGVPPLQKGQAERYGHRQDFQDYIASTPLLFPFMKPFVAGNKAPTPLVSEASDHDPQSGRDES